MAGVGVVPDEILGEHFNGDHFVQGQQGELEERLAHRIVYVYEGDAAHFRLGAQSDVHAANFDAAVMRTIRLNYWKLLTVVGRDAVTNQEAMRVAWLRVIGLSKGYGDTEDARNMYHVRYNEVETVDDAYTFDVPARAPAAAIVGLSCRTNAARIPGWNADVAWRNVTLAKVTNILCCIAYVMRARGHHWMEDSNDRYVEVWNGCVPGEENPGVAWRILAHHTFHYVYPQILDNIWGMAVNESRCTGNLIVRYSVAAAGTAAISSLRTGAYDLITVFPLLRNSLQVSFAELDRCTTALAENRWAGSINRRYYNGPALSINESRLAPLAAIVRAVLAGLPVAAPLSRSNALIRVANNAPITGHLMAMVITRATQDPRMVNALFPADEAPDEVD